MSLSIILKRININTHVMCRMKNVGSVKKVSILAIKNSRREGGEGTSMLEIVIVNFVS